MEVITPEKMISMWRYDKNRLVNDATLADTQWILEKTLGQTGRKTLHLNQGEVKKLVKGLYDHHMAIQQPITRKQSRQRVNRLLGQMNMLPNISATLVPEPILAHRPTTLPSSEMSFSAAVEMDELDRHLLTWSRHQDTIEAWMLVLAIRLMTRLGMGEKVMLGTLSQLTLRHIEKKRKSINIPSSPDALSHEDGHYRIALPDDIWVPLRAIVTRQKSLSLDTWLFAEGEKNMELSMTERRQVLHRCLVKTARHMIRDESASRETPYSHLATWKKITRASHYVPISKGIPSLWSTLLRDYPLPTCTPTPLLLDQSNAHHYVPGGRLGRLPDRQNKRILGDRNAEDQCHPSETRPAGVLMVETEHLPNDWPRQVKNILQQFLSSVSRLSKKKVNAKKFENPMRDLLELYESRINLLVGYHGHYPIWILHFLYYQLRTEGNTITTAKTYLSRLTPITIFYHDAVLDMSDWDDEAVLEMEISAKQGRRWSSSTLDAFRGSFRNFIKYCHQHGVLEDVSLPKGSISLTPSVMRVRILSPDHMQAVWEDLTKGGVDGSTFQMLALVIALGFYGGLRASEIESLTLNDIHFGITRDHKENTCWIDILAGKTIAARRRVALHIMSPPSVVNQLHQWVSHRRKECQQVALKDIALFGPRHSSNAYVRRHLITLAIDEMRERLGEDIDFHGLRHAAASWTLLRLHAAQHPGFAKTLQHQHHWMFQSQPLQQTLAFFCGAEQLDTCERGTMLLHVALWIGHRDPETLLKHYAHTLGLIHSDILAPKTRR